jgi:hypothetical protein
LLTSAASQVLNLLIRQTRDDRNGFMLLADGTQTTQVRPLTWSTSSVLTSSFAYSGAVGTTRNYPGCSLHIKHCNCFMLYS